MKLQVILEPSDEGGYTVYVPALPGCISEGDNVDEALKNIPEAIKLYLEPLENPTDDLDLQFLKTTPGSDTNRNNSHL